MSETNATGAIQVGIIPAQSILTRSGSATLPLPANLPVMFFCQERSHRAIRTVLSEAKPQAAASCQAAAEAAPQASASLVRTQREAVLGRSLRPATPESGAVIKPPIAASVARHLARQFSALHEFVASEMDSLQHQDLPRARVRKKF